MIGIGHAPGGKDPADRRREAAREGPPCRSCSLGRLPRRVPAVLRAADDRQDGAAAVRRVPGGLEHLHGVLPGGAAGGLRLSPMPRAAGSAPGARPCSTWACSRCRSRPCRSPSPPAAPARGDPALRLLGRLLIAAGLPFFVVATTAPLLQRWFAATGDRRAGDPYFLYAASNAGSLLALVGYVTLIEPNLTLGAQARLWAAGYGVLACLIIACAVALWRAPAVRARARGEASGSACASGRAGWPGVRAVEPAAGRDHLPDDGPRAGAVALGDPPDALLAQLHRRLREPPGMGPAGLRPGAAPGDRGDARRDGLAVEPSRSGRRSWSTWRPSSWPPRPATPSWPAAGRRPVA